MDRRGIGIRIQESRNKAGYTQEELAEILDLSNSFVTAMERDVKQPSVETLIKLAETLNVSSDWLLGIRRKRSGILDLQAYNEEFMGLPISAQKRIISILEAILDYETRIEDEK